jgi:hypothetical protein
MSTWGCYKVNNDTLFCQITENYDPKKLSYKSFVFKNEKIVEIINSKEMQSYEFQFVVNSKEYPEDK